MSNVTKALQVGLLSVALTGCGGGGSQENDSSTSMVSSVSPANGATGVSRSVAVTATFGTDIFASTVSDASFNLAAMEPVDGSVSFDALTNKATFTPTEELSLLTVYTAALSTDVTNLSGDPLSAEYSWHFTTADGTLDTTSEQVHSDSSKGLQNPEVSYAADGSAIALWQTGTRTYPIEYRVWASHYAPGTGWGVPFMLQTDDSVNGYEHQLALNDNGDAFAIWNQGYAEVWGRRYISETGTWEAPEKISAAADSVSYASIAMSHDGEVMALWSHGAGGNVDIYAKHYTPGIGWGTAEPIDNSAGDAYSAKVEFDGRGNAIAVWSQFDGSQFSIYGNRFVAGEGWGEADLLETIDTSPFDWIPSPELAVDDSGDAIVVWSQRDGTRENMWANRYDVSTGWQGAIPLENNDTDVGLPTLEMNRNGMAIAVWSKRDDPVTNMGGFVSRRYVPGVGWGPEETFDYTGLAFFRADVAIDDNGHALLFWANDEGESSILWFNRYRTDSGWGSAEDLSRSSDGYGEYSPRVSVKEDGEAMVIFSGDSIDGSEQVWSRLFH